MPCGLKIRTPAEALEQYVKDLKRDSGQKAQTMLAELPKAHKALTSAEKTRLLVRYLPEEDEAPKKLRKNSHKWLWRFLRRRDFKRFEATLEALRDRDIPFDEVTYNFAMYGILLHPRQVDELSREV
ncbi:unnamed protein product, partial [Effrenium voratum]